MIILIQCRDRVGLVASITGVLAGEQFNIVTLREHVDLAENQFFIRIECVTADALTVDTATLVERLTRMLPEGALVRVNPLPEKKIVVMVTKEYHCLSDILVRNYFGTLGAKVQCAIGNHGVLEDICRRFDIPFFLVSHEGKDKQTFEKEIGEIVGKFAPDYIVLAKFMRILSPEWIRAYPARIINIHHSFLPAFAGASPYKQAFERGVKLIGATAHFVTDHLDEGPIVAQQIIPVNHSYTTADMMKAGKEIESAVLARALRLIFEDRVLVFGNKTIIFE
jgi:formyltetrahydrofolate deformylase